MRSLLLMAEIRRENSPWDVSIKYYLRATAHAADPKRVWNRARQGHIEVVRSLTEAGSDKDKSSNTGSTPLYIAAQNGHIEIVCFWTEAGSDNLGQGKVFCRRRQVRRDAPSSLGK